MPMHVGWKPEGSYTYDALLVSSSDTRPSAPSTPSTVHYIYKKYYIRTKKKKSGDGLDLLAALAGGLGFCLLSLADDVHGHRL